MIEKKEEELSQVDAFYKESTPDPKTFGYVPLPTNVQGENTGSVLMANLRQENTIGSMLTKQSTLQLSDEVKEGYDFVNYANQIPRDLISYADRFFGATTDDEFKSIESQIRRELGDKSLIAANPLKSLAYSALTAPIEITNWLPGGVIYKDAKIGASVARSMMGGAIATAASTGVQEFILQQNQLTRTAQESMMNTVGAGILGGVIGGAISAYGSKQIANMVDPTYETDLIKATNLIKKDIDETINDGSSTGNLSAGKNAIMDDNEIARMPEFVKKSMKLTPMNRLLTSPFKVAKWFGSATYEHNYELVKNSDGKTAGSSLETQIKLDMREFNTKQIEHMNYYYDMHGVTGKYFKATRKKMQELGTESPLNINLAQFNNAVYVSALTGTEHAIPQVTSAARMWREQFDKLQAQAIDLKILPEDVKVPNAPNYIMIMYNKDLIIEQGGRSARGEGTFPQHLYNQFESSNETLRQFMESPVYLKAQAQIKDLEVRIKKSKPSEKTRLSKEMDLLEKSLIDAAPEAAKTWEGKLHTLIDEGDAEGTSQMIWTQVEQTIDNILGDADGKLLNPFLSKMGGATKPFQARKLIIDQLEASPWHITDIQEIANAHNRAMVPTIKLTHFAQANGFKDIPDMLSGVSDLMKKEFEEKSAGLTGKAAQKLRKQYDSAIKDMSATLELLQGVYGQGFNVLNSKGAEFFTNVMNWNYTRLLGHMTISSLPELGLLAVRNGLFHTLATSMSSMFTDIKKMTNNEIRAMGYAIETESASIFKSYMQHNGLSSGPNPFTKSLNSLTRNFGNLSLMNPWTDMVQSMAGHMSINFILRDVNNIVAGKKVSQKKRANLARLGIAEEHFSDIAKFTKDNFYKGTRFSDWQNWDIKTRSESYALQAFKGAVSKSIDEVSIMPKLGDKPLFLHQKGAIGNITRLTFQFKSYLMAVTNRVFYAGIQNRYDINQYTGLVAMMGLGMLGYMASSALRGSKEEIDLSPKNLLREGLDRSGALGILGEGINIGQKLFQLGEVSRYKSRDAFGSAFGPTGGSMSELVQLFNKLNPVSSAKYQWTTKDTETVMRLMPLQNLFYLQKINKMIMGKAAEALGAEGTL